MQLRATRLTAIAQAVRDFVKAFNPRSLFANGEQGVWYDPSDFKPDWRYNLLSRTEEFDNAVWGKTNATVIANTVVAPDGTLTADKLVENVTLSSHTIGNATISFVAGLTYTQLLYAKKAERDVLQVPFPGTAFSNSYVNFDLVDGVLGSSNNAIASIEDVGDDWYKCTAVATCNVSTVATAAYAIQASTTATRFASYTGDGTSGIYIWGASLTTAENADKPYQKITDGIQDYYTYQPQPVLFTDSAGTTPVTALEQPVGLMLDKSKGLVLGPEAVNNLPTGWSVTSSTTLSGNTFTTTSTGGLTRQALVVGKTYRLTVHGATTGPELSVNQTSDIGANTRTLIGTGFGSFTFTATAQFLYLRNSTAGVTTIDNISVRELPGNHATQPTATSRPIVSARVNLLTATEDIHLSPWTNSSGDSVTATTGQTDPLGGTKGVLLQNLSSSGGAGTYRQLAVSAPTGVSQTPSVWIKKVTPTGLFRISNPYSGSNGDWNVNLALVSSGWEQITAAHPAVTVVSAWTGSGGNVSGMQFGFAFGNPSPIDIIVWGADLRVANDGVNIPSYQRVNTATDYDSTGFPVYLRADGVDDGMVTNSIDFTATDKMTVVAGVRKLSDAASASLAEFSADAAALNGGFAIFAPAVGGANKFQFNSRGTSAVAALTTSTAFNAPITNVVTGIGNISGDSAILRINAIQAAISTADQGTGNYGNYPLYLFRRGGTTLPFNGHFYGLIVRGSQSTTAQIEATEAYINRQTGAFDYREITDTASFRWNSATASPDAE